MRRFTFDSHEGADGRTVDDVMAIKPNFLASMGYQYFLSYGAPRARSSAMNYFFKCFSFFVFLLKVICIVSCHEHEDTGVHRHKRLALSFVKFVCLVGRVQWRR